MLQPRKNFKTLVSGSSALAEQYFSAVSSSKNLGIAAATGHGSKATATGRGGISIVSSCHSCATAGPFAIAISNGYPGSYVQGSLNSTLIMIERDKSSRKILGIAYCEVDGLNYKPDTAYLVSGGIIVEATTSLKLKEGDLICVR